MAFSIPAAIGLTYLPFAVKYIILVASQGLDYNNESPRETKYENVFPKNEALQGFIRRCSGAHTNGFESLAMFAPAVIFAVVRGVPNDVIASYTSNFLYSRLLYNIAYMGSVNKPISYVRTMIWGLGVGIILTLFAVAAKEPQ